ncbi:Crp/Fnr family transcriptional regulator [Promineifilum sp.]|uniref:Crp/Fnr family transcriptional regulator n=1 Tax=Promineifilum sp. TaxID=2664178 RepID=UPI0035B43754
MTATIEIFKFEKNVDQYAAGDTIFRAGDEGHCMYVVQDGELEVIAHDKVIDVVTSGGIFGEMALVDRSPRSATVVARTDCRLVAIDEAKFMQHVHRTPFFALQVMRIMTDRLRKRLQDSAPAAAD